MCFYFSDYGALLTEDGDYTPEYLVFQEFFRPDAGTRPALQRALGCGGQGADVVLGGVQLAPARFILRGWGLGLHESSPAIGGNQRVQDLPRATRCACQVEVGRGGRI